MQYLKKYPNAPVITRWVLAPHGEYIFLIGQESFVS